MIFDIITIFPEMFAGVLSESIIARAIKAGKIEVRFTNPRDFTKDRHKKVDDKPYGGGPGMVFMPEPIFLAVEQVERQATIAAAEKTRRILLTPQGQPLTQKVLRQLSQAEWIILLCGHYEGFDERVIQGLQFEEISIGDYVLTGGEIPAMVIIDGVTRLLPGVLGNDSSNRGDSFEEGLLEFPQYTRPPEFRGMKVPEVLLSGNHQEIARWREEEAIRRTRKRRADLLEKEGSREKPERNRSKLLGR
ncbi:MAG: tRNA (guanosine(37)-N1)-methyltransferase TrmD [Planctomycetes bacterium]|nr:tRNA (guanosine(37)-N1)-methyltransferase TrmD [Planctomycetota bacterium]